MFCETLNVCLKKLLLVRKLMGKQNICFIVVKIILYIEVHLSIILTVLRKQVKGEDTRKL
jgi:hypothetical protein